MKSFPINIVVKLQFPFEEVDIMEGAIKFHLQNDTWEVLDRQFDLETNDKIVFLKLKDYAELAMLSSFVRLAPSWYMEILEGAVYNG